MSQALDYLRDFTSQTSQLMRGEELTLMRRQGYGPGYIDAFVRSAIARNRPQLLAAAREQKAQLDTSGMGFSGLGARIDANAVAGLAEVATSSQGQAWQANEQARMQAEQLYAQMAMHEDSLQMQRNTSLAQIEAMKPTTWDRILQGASLVSGFLPL